MKTQGWRLGTLAGFGVLASWFVACSGEDIPQVDNATRDALAEQYPDDEASQLGNAGTASSGGGAAGDGGSGGRASGGSGGRAGSASTSGGSGGSGSPAAGGSGSADVCDAFNTILQPRCGSAGCHGPGSSQGAFGVSEEGVTAFVNKKGTFASNGCDQSYIDSAEPDQSLIYLKLHDDFPLGCGNLQMPLNGDLLTEEELDCVLSWLGQF